MEKILEQERDTTLTFVYTQSMRNATAGVSLFTLVLRSIQESPFVFSFRRSTACFTNTTHSANTVACQHCDCFCEFGGFSYKRLTLEDSTGSIARINIFKSSSLAAARLKSIARIHTSSLWFSVIQNHALPIWKNHARPPPPLRRPVVDFWSC